MDLYREPCLRSRRLARVSFANKDAVVEMNRARIAILALSVLLFYGAPHNFCAARESAQRVQLAATYSVEFGAFNLGDFHLTATLAGAKYALKAKGKFSFISGMIYRASGRTESTGKLSKNGAEPFEFQVTYRGGSKKEERRFSFVNGAVDRISIVPAKKPNSRSVPITADQLKNVLDPLTAAFLSVRAKGSSSPLDICKRTIPVFDGRQRFDIVLQPKRSELMPEGAPAGVSGPLVVCRVMFVPIGGYRPDHPGIKFMTQTEDIEVWLVSMPGTNLYIPYRIFLPTAWANGVATLSEIELR
jgi:hypothetical protein